MERGFDKIIKKSIDKEIVEYGFIFGSEKILFIKVGAEEEIGKVKEGVKRYVEIARRAHEKYGATVICASNPTTPHRRMDEKAIRWAASQGKFERFSLYLWGVSDGAHQNLDLAKKFPEAEALVGVNTSFITVEDLEYRLSLLPRVRKILVFGTRDEDLHILLPAFFGRAEEYLKAFFVDGADHSFNGMSDTYIHTVDLIWDENTDLSKI